MTEPCPAMATGEEVEGLKDQLKELGASFRDSLPKERLILLEKKVDSSQSADLCEALDIYNGGTHAERLKSLQDFARERCIVISNDANDDHSTSYDYRSVESTKRADYSDLVDSNLRSFDEAPDDDDYAANLLPARVAKLDELLSKVEKLYKLTDDLEHSRPREDALLLLIEFTVPCVLHLENRTREALLSRIISKLHKTNMTKVAFQEKLNEVAQIINTKGHGDVSGRMGQVQITMNATADGIEKLSFNCERARKIMKNAGPEIAAFCYAEEEEEEDLETLLAVLQKYEELIEKLGKHADFTDGEIDDVSIRCSELFGLYMDVFKYAGPVTCRSGHEFFSTAASGESWPIR
jgi:hypothetical protein